MNKMNILEAEEKNTQDWTNFYNKPTNILSVFFPEENMQDIFSAEENLDKMLDFDKQIALIKGSTGLLELEYRLSAIETKLEFFDYDNLKLFYYKEKIPDKIVSYARDMRKILREEQELLENQYNEKSAQVFIEVD